MYQPMLGTFASRDPRSVDGVELLGTPPYMPAKYPDPLGDWQSIGNNYPARPRATGDYAYTDNNPVNRFDPSGLDWLDDITDNWFYKWLYAGDPTITTDEYRKCCEPAGAYVTCHVQCMADVNKQIAVIAAGGVGAGVNSRDVLPFPKWLARQLGFRVSGQSWFTSLARLKSTHPEKFCIPRAEREAWKQLANQIKSRPNFPGTQVKEIFRRGARGGIAAAAMLELLIALYCMDKCGGGAAQAGGVVPENGEGENE